MEITRAQCELQFEAAKLQRASDYEVSCGIYWNIILDGISKLQNHFSYCGLFFLSKALKINVASCNVIINYKQKFKEFEREKCMQ